MAKIHVAVTQEDIAKGKRFSRTGCAVYCALKRQGIGVVEVAPHGIQTREHEDPREYEAFFNEEITAWMIAFDRGEPVEPVAFDLEIPDEALR